jgi:tetratricopeptide (TPR) repeat protein
VSEEPKSTEESLAEIERGLSAAEYWEERGEYRYALEWCERAIEGLRAYLADAYNLRGILLEELGRDEEAVESYRRALEMQPGMAEAADNLTSLEEEIGIRHNLVTVAEFSQAPEAYVPKGLLEAEGIWAFIADEYTVTANWLYSRVLKGVKLQVRESDLEAARRILGLEEAVPEEEAKVPEEERCPRCGSTNIQYRWFSSRWVFLSWLLLGFPLPFLKRRWVCNHCGHEWR